MQVYMDNAATTPIDPEVIAAMVATMEQDYGNPSSIHAHRRRVKTIVEKARKTVAGLLNVSPAEIFFTSGGTERSEEHTSELQSRENLVCRLLLEKKKKKTNNTIFST